MIPRRCIDIGWADLAHGIACAFVPGTRAATAVRLESHWELAAHVVAMLSVRSALDALLAAGDFSPGDEVLMSAVNIRDMARVVEAHGLVPVPVDIDPDTLAVDAQALAAAVTARTRAVLIAHLYGSRMDLTAVVALARARGLLLIEDCAEAWTGDGWRGDARCDVRFFSFGPIKTATALAGGIAAFRDDKLAARVRAVQSSWRVQSRWAYLLRLVKYLGIRFMGTRPMFTLLATGCRMLRVDMEKLLGESTRGFAGADFFQGVRRRPSAPLLRLLARRIATYDGAPVRRRVAMAELATRLLPELRRPGVAARDHAHWVFPVCVREPDALIAALREHGFDATRGATSMGVISAPEGRSQPVRAQRMLREIVYLPVHEAMRSGDVERLAAALRSFAGVRATAAPGHAVRV